MPMYDEAGSEFRAQKKRKAGMEREDTPSPVKIGTSV